jgi:hypothetical protein
VVEGKFITDKNMYYSLEQRLRPVDSFDMQFDFNGDEVSTKEQRNSLLYAHLYLSKANTAVIEHEYIITDKKVLPIIGDWPLINIPENSSVYYQVRGKFYNLEKDAK